MTLIVKPDRLTIRVEVDGEKSVSFPGEWASNFYVNDKGELSRKDYENKFYVDGVKDLFWIDEETQVKLNEAELEDCIHAIQEEAKKCGWKIVWPH
jgi:hypothetical protein